VSDCPFILMFIDIVWSVF